MPGFVELIASIADLMAKSDDALVRAVGEYLVERDPLADQDLPHDPLARLALIWAVAKVEEVT